MTARGQVYLSELAEIIHKLSPLGPESQEMLLPMLHLGQHAGSQQAPRKPGPSSQLPPSPQRSPPPPRAPLKPSTEPAALQPIEGTHLVRLRRGSSAQPPDWSQVGSKLEPEPAPVPLPVPPLIESRKQTAILSTALATHVNEGRPLIEPIIRAISRATLLTELPRRSRPTLRRGVQVLVDTGDGMIPFDPDVQALVERVRKSVGQGRTEILSFTGSPLRGVNSGAPEEGKPWRPPMRGTPLLILTDLGLGGPAMSSHRAYAAEWARFAKSAHDAGCPPVVLVPYKPERWPRTLRDCLTLLHWDRRTTAGIVRHRRSTRPRGAMR
jgi:hypothetical protein